MTKLPFAVEKLAWYTGKDLAHDPAKKLKTIALFLQENALTTRRIIDPWQEFEPTFEISSADVTESGLKFLKKGYQKWVNRVDRGGDPADSTLLSKEFKNCISVKRL